MAMAEPHVHASHPDFAKRLKRAEGHLHKVTEMIETGRNCLDTRSAVAGARKRCRWRQEEASPGPS